MAALISEFLKYLIKFVCMVAFAAAGIYVGKGMRKKKNAELAQENTKE